jgi:P4 family phage/plasmid primase-like protien
VSATVTAPDVELIGDYLANMTHALPDDAGFVITSIRQGSGVAGRGWDHLVTGSNINEAAQRCVELARSSNVYLSTTATDKATWATTLARSPGARGGKDDARFLVGLFADLDVAGPNHKADNLPPTIADAESILNCVPEPSFTLASGGGLQAWWLFDEPMPITNTADAADLVDRWVRTLEAEAHRLGWNFDGGIGELARVLRPTGTLNHKRAELHLVDFRNWKADEDGAPIRYRVADLEAFCIVPLSTMPETISTTSEAKPAKIKTSKPSSSDLNILDACNVAAWEDIWPPDFEKVEPPTAPKVHGTPVELWKRPGASSSHSVTCWPDGGCRVFSDQIPGLDSGEHGDYSKAAILAWRIGTDLSELSKKILFTARDGETHGIPQSIADEARRILAANKERVDVLDAINPGRGKPSVVTDGFTPAGATGVAPQTPRTSNPSDFVGKDGLLVRDLVEAILDGGPIRPGLGGALWWYDDGVYLDKGEQELSRRAQRLLGNRYRRSHVDNAIAWIAAHHPFITDHEPTELLNTHSGLLNWRTHELRPHEPELPSTYQIPHAWNPTALCPMFDEWLTQVLPDDCHEFIWEVMGYLLLPANPFHKAILLHGTGRNGKSTWLRLVEHLIGTRHVSHRTLQELQEDRFATSSLYRKVANIAGDLDQRRLANTDNFKMATGGDPIAAQRKYGDTFEFVCTATFAFAANELPGTADLTEGFFSRWIVVPFRGYFPAGKADPHLGDRLIGEAEGIIFKAIEGLHRVMDRGRFDLPTSVLAATEDYRVKADPVRQFSAERIEVDFDAEVKRTWLHDAYQEWCRHNGYQPLATRRFYDRLRQIHVGRIHDKKKQGDMFFGGIRLLYPDQGGSEGAVGATLSTLSRTYGGKGRDAAPDAPLLPPSGGRSASEGEAA